MTLQLNPSEFPYIWRKFRFLFLIGVTYSIVCETILTALPSLQAICQKCERAGNDILKYSDCNALRIDLNRCCCIMVDSASAASQNDVSIIQPKCHIMILFHNAL
jgi:hypothetical protein